MEIYMTVVLQDKAGEYTCPFSFKNCEGARCMAWLEMEEYGQCGRVSVPGCTLSAIPVEEGDKN